MSVPRAVAVVTGSELVRGERTDLNGPFYMREALKLGLEPARIHVVGDDPSELERVLREAAGDADICLVSGGLGPTHDDRTVELVARVVGRSLELNGALEAEIETVSRTFATRMRRPYADFAPGVRKQATVPEGATVLGLAGTAPGLVVPGPTCVFVVLPGPPGELQKLWPKALVSAPVVDILTRAVVPSRRVQRFYGASESLVARALAELGGDGNGVEVTICARDFEIHVDTVYREGSEAQADAITAGLADALGEHLFSTDERSIGELVLEACRARGLRLATAESCTGGLAAARLTEIPGASEVFVGGIVAYANEVKTEVLGVDPALLDEHGAVSEEVARAMAVGVCNRLGADVAVAVTGIAGPGGGSPERPVGLVILHAVGPGGERTQRLELPGDRSWIRARSTVAALHLVRRLLTES